jgi:hypothetical protein
MITNAVDGQAVCKNGNNDPKRKNIAIIVYTKIQKKTLKLEYRCSFVQQQNLEWKQCLTQNNQLLDPVGVTVIIWEEQVF